MTSRRRVLPFLALALCSVAGAQVITEFPVPTAATSPFGIAAGSDGNLWFTESAGNQIGRITTAGVVTEFPIPTAASDPRGITAGPDGNLWFAENSANKIGRITTAGAITEFPVPTAATGPFGITAGPGWQPLVHRRDTATGSAGSRRPASSRNFPSRRQTASRTASLAGPDGNLWFTENPSP